MDFMKFKAAVAAQFARMAKLDLYRSDAEYLPMWEHYLASFPEGTNPIFRERTDHDCSCCRNFIRDVGNVVAIQDGNLVSIWDVQVGDPTYQVVADKMAERVKSGLIVEKFLHYQGNAGTDKNFEEIMGQTKTWNHFYVDIPKKFVSKQIATDVGIQRSTYDVLLRSLKELSLDDVDTVLDLIAQNSLYRGEEHKFVLTEFRKLKVEFDKLGAKKRARNRFTWSHVGNIPDSVARIRNTSIGTILVDLAEGKTLEDAVKAFEFKVAPANYQRPSALVTPKMVEKAKGELESLGLLSALERRFATAQDLTVNNVLFADRSSRRRMGEDVFDDLGAELKSKPSKAIDRVEEMGIEKFISDVLPKATSIEVLVENKFRPNLVSLIAPVNATSGNLFKWRNNFSWAYEGEVADSIKERVKKAGGNVEGDVCCRLSWFNYDDLDFHMVEPDGYHLYFSTRHYMSPSGGRLDVDMNAGSGQTRQAVENIFYAKARTMKPGEYKLFVHNFAKRESTDVGFEVEIDVQGEVFTFSHADAVRNDGRVPVATLIADGQGNVTVKGELKSRKVSKDVWGLKTESYQKVSMMLLSPNHWDGEGVGNKHYFFMLEGCANPDPARGFFNEFLNSNLSPHRKVFEVVGSKMKAEPSPDQLSGLGFSSTKRDSVILRVKGSFTRTIKVMF